MSSNSNPDKMLELSEQVWTISNNLRQNQSNWQFKSYVLGTLFYRFLSETVSTYINQITHNYNYHLWNDQQVTDNLKAKVIKHLGYFLYPSQLCVNVSKTAIDNPNLLKELNQIFTDIEFSSSLEHVQELDNLDYKSNKPKLLGVFTDYDLSWSGLGATPELKRHTLAQLLTQINDLNFSQNNNATVEENQQGYNSNLLGRVFTNLIDKYCKSAGRLAGEVYTTITVSKLIAQLIISSLIKTKTSSEVQTNSNTIDKSISALSLYDPTIGTGSLLVVIKQLIEATLTKDNKLDINNTLLNSVKVYGQDINRSILNLAQMNLIVNHQSLADLCLNVGDVMFSPQDHPQQTYDLVVSHHPYSEENLALSELFQQDSRFSELSDFNAPIYTDYIFILHALSKLSQQGLAFIICFPGILYREGPEQRIRQYLIENNFIDSVIELPGSLFLESNFPFYILVLSKHKINDKILFIDANQEFTQSNSVNGSTEPKVLSDKNIDNITQVFTSTRELMTNVTDEQISSQPVSYNHTHAQLVDKLEVEDNNYNLIVSNYIRDTNLNIEQLESEINQNHQQIQELNAKLHHLVVNFINNDN